MEAEIIMGVIVILLIGVIGFAVWFIASRFTGGRFG